MLNFLKSLFMPPPPSGALAKERLRLVLLSDHLALSPDVVDALKRDLLEVISRYVEIDFENADVTFEHREREVAMLASIPITGVRDRQADVNGARTPASPPTDGGGPSLGAVPAPGAGPSEADRHPGDAEHSEVAGKVGGDAEASAASAPVPNGADAAPHDVASDEGAGPAVQGYEPPPGPSHLSEAEPPPVLPAQGPGAAGEIPAAAAAEPPGAAAEVPPPSLALGAASPKTDGAGQSAAQRRRRRKKARAAAAQSVGFPAQA